MRKNYPLRRWKSENERALLYIELDESTRVISPRFESVLGKKFPTSWSDSYFKKKFKSCSEAKTFARKMKSPFEIQSEKQGFLADLEIIYN